MRRICCVGPLRCLPDARPSAPGSAPRDRLAPPPPHARRAVPRPRTAPRGLPLSRRGHRASRAVGPDAADLRRRTCRAATLACSADHVRVLPASRPGRVSCSRAACAG
jgi:hypothetical protein